MDFSLTEFGRYLGIAIEALMLFSFGVLAIEIFWLWRGRRLTKPRVLEMLASYSPLVPTLIAEALVAGAWIAIYLFVEFLVPWDIPVTWASALIVLLLVDLAYYWEHRWEHEIRVLWALYHSVHHSSPDFNQSTAYRVSFVDQFFTPLFFLPLVGAGFHPGLVLACLVFIVAYQTWIHTEMIGRLGWLDKVFNTPSNHRVHHGSDAKYRDRNYGAVLIVWDRLFGTYQAEEARPTYGLTKPLDSVSPIKVHFHELTGLVKDLHAARSGADCWGYLFRRPGWQAGSLPDSAKHAPGRARL